MSDQPEALKLAGELVIESEVCNEAAACLRRLHAEVERLRADAEPVAWRFRLPSGKQWHFTEHRPHEYTKRGLHFEPLYTNPTALKEPK